MIFFLRTTPFDSEIPNPFLTLATDVFAISFDGLVAAARHPRDFSNFRDVWNDLTLC